MTALVSVRAFFHGSAMATTSKLVAARCGMMPFSRWAPLPREPHADLGDADAVVGADGAGAFGGGEEAGS
jgi:hypothetical protein